MKRILSMLLVVLMTCSLLAACGKGSEAGTYNMVSMTLGDSTVTAEDLAALGMPADGIYVKLNGDGTGEMNAGEETVEIRYDNSKLWPVEEPDEKIDYTLKGKTLTVSDDETVMVFEK